MTKQISEVFAAAHACETDDDRVIVLQKNDSPTLQTLLNYAYNPDVRFALPDGDPPHKIAGAPSGLGETNLIRECRKLYLFLDPETGGHPTLMPMKREQLFISLLEDLSDDDAKVLLSVKNKDLTPWSITDAVVRKAFPNLLPKRGRGRPRKTLRSE